MLTWIRARPLPLTRLGTQDVARFPLPLADPTTALLTKGKMGQLHLRHRNTDEILALAPNQLTIGNIFTQVFANLAFYNLLIACAVLFNLCHMGLRCPVAAIKRET